MKSQPAAERRAGLGLRPMLLALGLALVWLVEFQTGAAPRGAPVWGGALITGGRFIVDFIGAWVCISGLRLAVALSRLGMAYWRARGALGAR